MTVHGTTEKYFEPVREAFAGAQADDPGGAQLCIYRRGEVVVDLWTGRDIANDRPYTEDTLTVLMSCTKGAVAICAGMLAERGLLDVRQNASGQILARIRCARKATLTVSRTASVTPPGCRRFLLPLASQQEILSIGTNALVRCGRNAAMGTGRTASITLNVRLPRRRSDPPHCR